MVAQDCLLKEGSPRIRAHCSHWFTQTAFPYDFDPKATCPLWEGFLEQVLETDRERIALIRQWFGYCLTDDTTQQKFVVAIGEGQNGKSVMLDVLTALLGPDNVSHVPFEVFGKRFQLTVTLGKLANISSDAGRVDESAEGAIKQFAGGDRMYFDRKGVPGIFAYPSARLILATNHEPHFADRSKGIWRRMIVVPFNKSIPREQQDPQLGSKLKPELSGIFNWAVEGLRQLRSAGRFKVPPVCEEASEHFRCESNPAQEYLVETYEQGIDGDSVACASIYAHYTGWCAERG
jgi:putative DNA primase/helicase